MSKKSNKLKLSDYIWQKRVPKQFITRFTDAFDLYNDLIKNNKTKIIFSAGSLDPNKLVSSDHKKHAAIYVSINDMPEFFDKKKFGTNAKLKKHFLNCQEFAEKYISGHMKNDSFLSVEIMGIQKNSFNKLESDTVVIPHGSIIAIIKDLSTKEQLEELCEESIFEGYVILDNLNCRMKLKREYFDSNVLKDKQRGCHNIEPESYTNEGLKLCKEKGLAYDQAVISMLSNNINEQVTIAKFKYADLIALPIDQVIEKQNKFPFDGDKMLNFYETIGKGDSYRYIDKTLIPNIFERKLEFQLKFDGETGKLYKDNDGKVHLLIKFVIDIYEIEDDGTFIYRFGWLN